MPRSSSPRRRKARGVASAILCRTLRLKILLPDTQYFDSEVILADSVSDAQSISHGRDPGCFQQWSINSAHSDSFAIHDSCRWNVSRWGVRRSRPAHVLCRCSVLMRLGLQATSLNKSSRTCTFQFNSVEQWVTDVGRQVPQRLIGGRCYRLQPVQDD